MMDLQAAIGIHQLRRVEKNWLRRQEIWKTYNDAFRNLPIALPRDPAVDTRHAYHLYTILVDEERAGISRDNFLEAMTKQKIGVGVHYLSVPEHPYYQAQHGWRPSDYPNAMRIGRQTVSLPLSPKLSNADVDDVIHAVNQALASG
jgi:dTDP-4-amino-4,6-dideoxygalactose transaminase